MTHQHETCKHRNTKSVVHKLSEENGRFYAIALSLIIAIDKRWKRTQNDATVSLVV